MNKLNICIDIDGTITNPYHFLPYLNELYNKNITDERCNTCRWEDLYEVDMKTMLDEFHNKYMHSYGEAEIVSDAKEIINELKSKHNLYFVTARSENLEPITKDWLNNNGISGIDVYLLGSDNKLEKAKELNSSLFIEDNPHNAMQLADGGFKVILINTNYNKEAEHENIVRVDNWKDIKKIIDSHS